MGSLVEKNSSEEIIKTKFDLKIIALWVLQILSALLFFMAGFSKVSGAEAMVKEFNLIGFGQGLRYITGILELIGAFLLLVPSFSFVGSLILSAVMFGAVGTHLVILKDNPTFAAVILIIQLVITLGYKDRIINLIRK
ncbi:MAG: DoxX family protein [Candidatus Sericytochromatia bacterium]